MKHFLHNIMISLPSPHFPVRVFSGLLLASFLCAQDPINIYPPIDPEYPYPPEEPCCPDSCSSSDDGSGGNSSSAGNCPPCEEVGSIFFTMSLGRTLFQRRKEFFDASRTSTDAAPKTDESSKYCTSGMAHKVRTFEKLNKEHRRSPLSARRDFRIWIAQENITPAIYLPTVLQVDGEATAEKLFPGEEGLIRQVITDDRFADIQVLADVRSSLPTDIQGVLPTTSAGFVIRTWFAWQKGSLSGTYGLPSADPLCYYVFYNPDAPADNGRLNIIQRVKFNSTSYKTRTYTHHQDSTSHDWTSRWQLGLPGGTTIRETTLDVVSWTNHLDYTRIRTVKEAELQTNGTLGALQTISVTREDFNNIGGTSRLVEEIAGHGSGNERITRYGYYTNSAASDTFGRLKWRSDPDGSFVYYEFNFDTSGHTSYIIEKRPWKGYKWDPVTAPSGPDATNCLIKTTSTSPKDVTVQTVAPTSQTVARQTENWNSDTGDDIHTLLDWYDAGNYLSTITAYHPSSAGHQAGRIKWRELPDGTAERYSYTAPNGSGEYTQTVETGAGNRNGVTSGTRVVSTRSRHGLTIEEHTYHFHGGTSIELSNWVAESSTIDYFGRPTKRIHNADVNDFDQTLYGCCGIASFRDRKGILTEYFQDDISREYKTVTTSGSSVVTTETHHNGLETTVRRKSGSLDVLVSKTWSRTNGEIEKTHAPDENNDSAPEEKTYSYDYPGTGGRIVTETRPDGATDVTEYFTDGRVKSVTGTPVADVSYDYGTHNLNGGGLTTTVTRPTTASPTGEWVKTYTDRYNRTFRTEYPTQIRTPGTYDKVETTFFSATAALGSRGKPYQTTDPDGVTVTYAYDAEGERYSTTEIMPGSVGNRVIVTTHDAVNDPEIGACMRYTNTLNGTTTSVTLKAGTGLVSRVTSFGRTTTTASTPGTAGAWFSLTIQPDGTRDRQVFSNGLLQATERRDNTNANGNLGNIISYVSQTYDGLGRMLTATDSRTGTTNYNSHTESGNLLSETDPGSRNTTYAYDKMGRLTLVNRTDTPIVGGTAANQTMTSYYPTGTVKAEWGDQANATFRIYDQQNRMTELRTYRSLGHGTEPVSGTSGFDATTWSYHTQRGWLSAKEYPDGQDSGTARDPGPSYTYTAAGRLRTRTWGGGKHTRYDYRQGFLIAKRHFTTAGADDGTNVGNDVQTPDVGLSYTARGELQNVISSSTSSQPGNRQLYHYDATTFRMFRELQQMGPGISFTLDAAATGITIVITNTSITRWLHHKADFILRNTGADLRQTLSAISTLNIGSTVAYGATDGRLLSITSDFVGTTGTYNYAYEPDSNSDLIDTVTGPVHTVDNQWETTRDALDWKENKVGTDTISKYDYSVNAIGQRDAVAATSTVGTFGSAAPNWNWGYNVRGELVSSEHVNTAASSRHYTFDGIGNRNEHREGTHTSTGGTAKTYTPNALNQYDAVGSLSPVYDLDGNMTSGPLPVVPGANSALVWDGNNQLIEVTPSGGSAVQYHYDAIGRRIARTVGGTRTYWFYDGWNVVAEFSGAVHTSGTAPAVTLEKTWLWGTDLSGTLQGAGGVGGLLAINLETGAEAGVYHPLYDGNGNIGQYVNSAGTAVAKYEYDGFGNSLVSAGTHAALFPHRFSTKPLDAETGLYYYLYRHYDPLTGRWSSRDPIEEQGGVNLYGSLGNNMIDYVDFLGLAGETIEVKKCTAYLVVGHGSFSKPIKWVFPNQNGGCAIGGAATCWPESNNNVPESNKWPNLPNHNDRTVVPDAVAGTSSGDGRIRAWNSVTRDSNNDEQHDEDHEVEHSFDQIFHNALSRDSLLKIKERLCKCCEEIKLIVDIRDDGAGDGRFGKKKQEFTLKCKR
jgi:RHS repeat-associated protein